MAVLVSWQGQVERDHADQVGQFTSAERGAHFASGDGLRTFSRAQARLKLRGASYILVQSDTTIRFWQGKKRGLQLKVQTGDANVIADQSGLELETEFGVAVLAPGSQLRIRPGKQGQHYEVTMGSAMLVGPDGRQLPLAQGDGIGTPVVDAEPQAAPEEQAAEPAANPQTPDQSPEPSPLRDATGPADVLLPMGGTLTIYDPKPPSAVSLEVPDICPLGAQLSVRGRAAQRVANHETLMFSAGAHNYRLACLDSKQRPGPTRLRGTLHVLRNPGTAQLPRSAPKNTIEADGRTYTILFQNLLPSLEVRWPQPPVAKRYTLELDAAGGRSERIALNKPVHVFAAGALPEGSHRLRFVAELATPVRSKQTTLELRFDNAAPSASLRAPDVAGFAPGSSVHVAGIALPGSQVSVFGQRLALDAQQRFAGDIPLSAGTRAIAVRIAHPRTGTRYYIRRVRSSP